MHDPYLNPKFSATTLDSFANRRLILKCVKDVLPRLSGTLLDVGCGHKPYRSLIEQPPSQVNRYIGLDLEEDNLYQTDDCAPELTWDGKQIPLEADSVDCAIATEVLEHCPNPDQVLSEISRVLRPSGLFFMTAPFLWPLHTVPNDEYRYTPFSLKRHLANAGFKHVKISATGGWDASMAIMLGLWVRRRPPTLRVHLVLRKVLSTTMMPVIGWLLRRDQVPVEFHESTMVTGLAAIGIKPGIENNV